MIYHDDILISHEYSCQRLKKFIYQRMKRAIDSCILFTQMHENKYIVMTFVLHFIGAHFAYQQHLRYPP